MAIISPKNINNAVNAVSTLDTPELRKKAYISQLSVDIVSEYLEQAGITVNIEQAMFNNLLLLNEFNFADLQAQNVRIDIRTLIGPDYPHMWIPKSHFTYGLTPDIYLGLRISQDISEADVLGFIAADKINRFSGRNREFVVIETEQLTPLSELVSYVKNFEKKKNSFTTLSHEKVRNLFFAYIDGEIEKQDKIYLLKHIAKCEACAKEFNTCLGLDKNFRSIRKIPGFLIDLPFEKPNSAIETLEDSIKANSPINIIAASAAVEQNLDIICNTTEAVDTGLLLDKIKKAIANGNIEQISSKDTELSANQVDDNLSLQESENGFEAEGTAETQNIRGRKRKNLSRKFKKAARIIKRVLGSGRKPKSQLEAEINVSEELLQDYSDANNDEFAVENESFEDYSDNDILESNEKADFNLEGKVESFDELFADVSDEELTGFSEISEPDNSYEEDAIIDEVAPISAIEYELSQLDSIQDLSGNNDDVDDFEEVGNLDDYLSGKVLENQILDDSFECDAQEMTAQENVPQVELIVDSDRQEAINTLYPAENCQDEGKIFKNLARKLREENFGNDNFEVKELAPGEIQDVNLSLNESEFKAEDLEGSIKDTEMLQDLLGVKGFEFNEEKVKELSEKLAEKSKESDSSNVWNGNAELDVKIKEILESLDDVEIIENIQELSRLSGNSENNNENAGEVPQENTHKLPQEFVNLEQIVKNDKKPEKKTAKNERGNNAGLIAAAAVITAAGMLTYIGMNFLKPEDQTTNITNNQINIAQNSQPVNNVEPGQTEQNTQPQHPEPRVVKQEEQQIPLAEIKNKKMTELASNRNINDVLANAFINQGNEIKITNISWEIKPSLASQATFKNYLMVTGQVLKMSLSRNLLAANDRAMSNKVKVKVVLAPNGGIQESIVKETSGSKQIDEIVLTTLKETFAYTKMPVNLNIKDPVTTNVIISL